MVDLGGGYQASASAISLVAPVGAAFERELAPVCAVNRILIA
jgi:hypothetical protein